MNGISALILTQNDASTVARAISSALSEVDKVIVVDNASEDSTVDVVSGIASGNLSLFTEKSRLPEGAAKTICLQKCETPYAAWLGSKDEFLPGRIAKLRPFLDAGYGWVLDDLELCDTDSRAILGRTVYPDFVRDPDGICYQFARNYIKGEGTPLVNIESALRIGYRPLHAVSGYDHFLRAVINSEKIKVHAGVSYRKSISKGANKDGDSAQKDEAKYVLRDIGFQALERRLAKTELTEPQKYEIKLFYLSNIDDWKSLRELVRNRLVCESNYFNWLVSFMEGVADYKLGDFQNCLASTSASLSVQRRPESLNNLAVCRSYLGEEYLPLLEEALAKSPEYQDAIYNKRWPQKKRITSVPLRGFDLPEYIGSSAIY